MENKFARQQHMSDTLRSWMMTALTFLFVLLYGSALVGWIRPLADERMISRLEPIIFVIIGYYFGRLPSQQNESTLKDEINRQTQKAEAAQHAKEQAQQARESLEEKMKNLKAALMSSAVLAKGQAEGSDRTGAVVREDNLHQTVSVAINILKS